MEGPIHHVSIHGHDMAYRMEGSGPALLLLHGIAGSSRTWRDVIPRLTDRYTVIAPDLMGHGCPKSRSGTTHWAPSPAESAIFSRSSTSNGIRRRPVVRRRGRTCSSPTSTPSAATVSCSWTAAGLGREVNWMLRIMTLPGSEYLMPLHLPVVRPGLGSSLFGRVHRPRYPPGPFHRAVERLRLARRVREPSGVRPDHQFRHRPRRPDGERRWIGSTWRLRCRR